MENQRMFSNVEVITPAIAERMLKNAASNRRLSEKKVQDYAKQITDGEWRLNGEPIIIGKSGNLLDGQHRLRAVIYANKEIKSLVVYNADDDAFDTIDSGKSRSLQDVFSSNGIQKSQLISSIVKKYMLIVSNPKCCFFRDYSRTSLSRKRMLAIYFANKVVFDEAASAGSFFYGRKRLISPANIGAIYAYLVLVKKTDWSDVQDFFDYLFSSKELTGKFYAATVVRGKIIDSALLGKKYDYKVLQNMIAIAWNSYLNNTEVKYIKASGEEIIEFE